MGLAAGDTKQHSRIITRIDLIVLQLLFGSSLLKLRHHVRKMNTTLQLPPRCRCESTVVLELHARIQISHSRELWPALVKSSGRSRKMAGARPIAGASPREGDGSWHALGAGRVLDHARRPPDQLLAGSFLQDF